MAINYKKGEICKIEYKKGDISSKALEKFYKNLDKHYVTVGIHKEEGSKQYANGRTVLKNACTQEFGYTQKIKETRRFHSPFTGQWFTFKKGWEIEIPARPFVRIFNEKKNKQELSKSFKNQIDLYKEQKDGEQKVLEGVGDIARLMMKEKILSHKVKAEWKKGKPEGISAYSNTKTTQKYKGSNTPLYLTGTLFDSIKSKVKKKNIFTRIFEAFNDD